MVMLLLTALASILLGTGLPTTATYLIVAILVAPALSNMGVPPLAAHLFVFYFGVISDLTPPTAVSCYVAGGIAGVSGMRVAFAATRIALPALIVPFMFVYQPALLMQGSFIEVLQAGISTLVGVVAVAVALVGHWVGPLRQWEKAGALVAGGLLIVPGLATGAVGLLVLVIVAASAWRRRDAEPNTAPALSR
jgi:TRAP-type uncharacterized transport system fused permease subunit